ncbi:MAG: Sec-independent protein translocase protein TatB [Rhodospirillales bacterium]
MFDIGWQELFIIAIVGIIVIGPKELPRAVRAIAGIARKARAMAHEFQDGVDDMIRHADMEDIKKQVTDAGDDFKGQIEKTVDPDGTVRKDFDLTEYDDGDEDDDKDGRDLDEETDEDLDVLPEKPAQLADPSKDPKQQPAPHGTGTASGPASEPVTQNAADTGKVESRISQAEKKG